MTGLTSLKSLSVDKIKEIITVACSFKNGLKKDYSDKVMATLFFENSTRTQYSFQMAMIKLGITPVSFSAAGSSVQKGESLYDTVKTFESIGVDGMVIRHSQDCYYRDLTSVKVPIFNAGDGSSDHPTQTLLDLMTIYEEYGKFDGLKVLMVGDIVHSRVAHGNAEIMKRLGMDVYIAGPDEFLDNTGKIINIDDGIKQCDIVNLLRVQFERHSEKMGITVGDYHKRYGMSVEREKLLGDNAIIIHPAPFNRGVEIAHDVVECEKSRIFKQMQNGVFVRMAVISMVLDGNL